MAKVPFPSSIALSAKAVIRLMPNEISIPSTDPNGYLPVYLDDVPNVFDSVAKLATCYAGTQAVVADADRIVLNAVGEVVVPFCHGTDKDAHALFGSDVFDVILDPNNVCIIAECHFPAIRR